MFNCNCLLYCCNVDAFCFICLSYHAKICKTHCKVHDTKQSLQTSLKIPHPLSEVLDQYFCNLNFKAFLFVFSMSIRYSFTSNTRCWYCAQLTHAVHVSRGGAHAGAAQHRVCVRAAHVECVHGWSGAPPLVQLRPCLPSRTPAPLGQHVDVKLTKEGRRLWRALLLYRGGWRRR